MYRDVNVYIESIGCKLNQSEAEGMARSLGRAGHQVVYDVAQADLCLVNSCAVTHVAARKTRQALRRLAGARDGLRVLVVGCYAELWPAELAQIAGVEVLAGPAAKEQIAALLGETSQVSKTCEVWTSRRTRAFVKVQDGCNNQCTYCVVRLARGRERSRPLPDILDEVRALRAAGVQEIVLTGVHVGAYGRDLGLDLADLAGAILGQTDLPRLRLSSIEPWHLEERFLDLWREPRLCRHLHLPLQSGCDATLRRMGRRYTAGEFAALATLARRRIPGVAITTDVMVGFPGESDAEFAESLRFVDEIGFSKLHVFRYSARPGTPAARFPDQVPPAARAARSDAMLAAGEASGRRFRAALIGQTLPVLWETAELCEPCEGSGTFARFAKWEGLTDTYVRVRARSERDLHNQIVPAELTDVDDEGMVGRLL